MFPREFFWAAVFGAIGGVITVFCLNALKTAGEAEAREAEAREAEASEAEAREAEAREAEVQYAGSQNHPQEHDERSC